MRLSFFTTQFYMCYMELDDDDDEAFPTGGELELKKISKSFSDDVGATVDGCKPGDKIR